MSPSPQNPIPASSSGSSGGPARPPAPAASSGEGDMHLLDRLAVVHRYRQIAVAVFALTALTVMIQGYTSVKIYRAQARLLIEPERSSALPGSMQSEAIFEDPEIYYQTQYKIIKSREIGRLTAKRLKLETVPEFNGSEAPPTTPFTLLRSLQNRVIGLVKSAPVVAAPKADESAGEASLVNGFLSRVNVEPVRNSHLVDVLFDARDPKFAADAANALAEVYVEQNFARKQFSAQNQIAFLTQEVEKQKQKVGESQRHMGEYREKQNALSLDQKQNVVTSRLTKYNDDFMQAKNKRSQKEIAFKQLQAASTGLDALSIISADQTVQTLKTQLDAQKSERVQLLETYRDAHPKVLEINAKIGETSRQLDQAKERAAERVKNEYESAVIEEQNASRQLDLAKAESVDLNRKGIDYGVMEREAQSNEEVLNALLQRENELRVASNSKENNVSVIERAEVPGSPMSAGGRRTWLLAVLVGFAAALGVVFTLDYMNDTIKTPEDIASRLRIPFLGLIPSVRGDKHPLLTSSHVPHDFGEAFRSLRTSLISRFQSEAAKVLIVTSAQPLEGKTTTAVNIAMALAYGGARVLLIDADMRRPGMHRALRLTNDRGLSQVLTGQARIRDVIQRTVDPNLLAVTAGKTPPNPSELLASERMKTLIANLAHGPFDWILIDTPPVLAVTDAVILTPSVSGALFVIGSEMTRRRLAERAVETLQSSHPRQVAAVLNRVDFARNKYYYSRYHGHQYKNYYAEAI
jgi:capsular exopolysaccharide synthesis family protein